jgi:hypothetical protein
MLQGTEWRSSVASTPATKRSRSCDISAKAESVSTPPSVAQVAASDSALPASVPPTPPVSS